LAGILPFSVPVISSEISAIAEQATRKRDPPKSARRLGEILSPKTGPAPVLLTVLLRKLDRAGEWASWSG
jgi:hypothetical protein